MSDFNNGDTAQPSETQRRTVRIVARCTRHGPDAQDNQMPRKPTIDRAIDEVRLDLSAGPAGNDR